MSYPILYSTTETKFDHNGIGILSACVSCEVTEEANGIFELAMQYPFDGIHCEKIENRSIIKANVDRFRNPQLFRVYSIGKPMAGIVNVLAEHISYGLSGIPVKPFSAPNVSTALKMLKQNAVTDCQFDFWTDKNTSGNFVVPVPSSIRSNLGGSVGSILDVYGGEYEFDNFTVKLHAHRGEDRGFSVRYGKNLVDIHQEQNCSSVATGVYPYWASLDGSILVELPEKIVKAHGTYDFERIITVDFSADFETQPTVEQLRSRTQSYIKSNNIGVPDVSFTLSFAQLSKSKEYEHLALLERVGLFDTIRVEFPALNISTSAKVVSIVYDVIFDRIISVTLGSIRTSIADTVANQNIQIVETAKNEAFRAVKSQTSEDVFNRLTDNGRIQGIYIKDNRWYINAEIAQVLNLVAQSVASAGDSGITKITESRFAMERSDSDSPAFEMLNAGFGCTGIFLNESGQSVLEFYSSPSGFSVGAVDEQGDFTHYKLKWTTINGVPVLSGY